MRRHEHLRHLALVAAGAVALLVVQDQVSLYLRSFLMFTMMYVVLALSWNIISGFTGYTSFGHVVFYGIGSYACAILVADHRWHWVPTLGVGAVVGFLVALAIGYSTAVVGGLGTRERKAMTFEVGIRNAGLGLGLVFAFFGGLGGMAIVAGWWGIWDIIAGLVVAALWARHTKRRTGSAKGDASRHALRAARADGASGSATTDSADPDPAEPVA